MESVPMIRVGLIGFGLAGRVFHAPYIQATPGLALSAVATSRIGEVYTALPGVPVVTTPELIDDASIDLIVLATPNATHLDLGLRALDAGKAVVIDKPMALSADDAHRLVDRAAAKGRILCPYQNRRWDDDFTTLLRLVETGDLGELTSFESRFDRFRPMPADRWREQPGPGTGIWWDLGPHLADQACRLMGRPDAVTADIAIQRPAALVPDHAHVILHYGARRAVLRANCLVSSRWPRLAAEGLGGAFVTYGLDPQEERLRAPTPPPEPPRFGELTRIVDGQPVHGRTPLDTGDYGAFWSLLRDAIDKRGPPPISTEDALLVAQVLETAEASAAAGKTLPIPA